MAASSLGLLGLVIPPLGLLSGAAVALVALRAGASAVFQTLVFALPVASLLGFLLTGDGLAVLTYLLLQWCPLVLLGLWLGMTRSLASAILLALVPALLVIVIDLLLHGGDIEHWRSLLEPARKTLAEANLMDEAGRERLLQFLASWMTGILAAGYFLQNVFSLLIARWWQSQLYNPGGFRQEFHQLRLNRVLAPLGFGSAGLSLLLGENSPSLVDYLALLTLSAGVLQGLALVHGALAIRGMSIGWLVGLYLLLFIALAQTATLLAFIGLADTWYDLRSRLQPLGPSGSNTPPKTDTEKPVDSRPTDRE